MKSKGTDTNEYRGTRAVINGGRKLSVHGLKDHEVSLRMHAAGDYEFASPEQVTALCAHLLSASKGREISPQQLEAL